MSNGRGYVCLLQELGATVGTTNCPKTYEHADLRACRTQQNECPKPAHVLASGSGLCNKKTLGLDHRDEFEGLPSKVLYETWDICNVDIDGVHTIQLWPPGQHRPVDPLGL